ncbi:protein preY, mitochondrial [Brachyistius frenatus]|uniref:protein preY, mitochondrial n=1 Tax=Brachyistius frenatus TaxID=100188 RepID=UPI0037E84849
MLKNVLSKLATLTVRVHRDALTQTLTPASVSARSFAAVKKDEARPPFDASLLDFLVCPLSKKPLRYEAKTHELINDELGIAYPIVDGIPNMIPQEARLVQTEASSTPAQ